MSGLSCGWQRNVDDAPCSKPPGHTDPHRVYSPYGDGRWTEYGVYPRPLPGDVTSRRVETGSSWAVRLRRGGGWAADDVCLVCGQGGDHDCLARPVRAHAAGCGLDTDHAGDCLCADTINRPLTLAGELAQLAGAVLAAEDRMRLDDVQHRHRCGRPAGHDGNHNCGVEVVLEGPVWSVKGTCPTVWTPAPSREEAARLVASARVVDVNVAVTDELRRRMAPAIAVRLPPQDVTLIWADDSGTRWSHPLGARDQSRAAADARDAGPTPGHGG